MENTSPISAGFQLNVSMVNWDMMACSEPLGIQSRNAAMSSRFKFLMDRMLKSWINGLSRAAVIFWSLFFFVEAFWHEKVAVNHVEQCDDGAEIKWCGVAEVGCE